MADPNKAVFDFALQVFSDVVVDTAGTSAEQFRRRVISFLDDYMEGLYPAMFHQLDTIYTNRYDPLSQDYEDRKARLGRGLPDFLRFRGELEDYLLNRNAKRDFGTPKAIFTTQGQGVSKGVTITPQGRARSIRTGRFVSNREAFSSLVFTVEIQMFPRIQGDNYEAAFDRYAKKQRVKFAVFEFGRKYRGGKVSYQPPRPLLRAFLPWYATTNLRTSIAQKLGVQI